MDLEILFELVWTCIRDSNYLRTVAPARKTTRYTVHVHTTRLTRLRYHRPAGGRALGRQDGARTRWRCSYLQSRERINGKNTSTHETHSYKLTSHLLSSNCTENRFKLDFDDVATCQEEDLRMRICGMG